MVYYHLWDAISVSRELTYVTGGVELLDDLDDHWTAKNHKGERNFVSPSGYSYFHPD